MCIRDRFKHISPHTHSIDLLKFDSVAHNKTGSATSGSPVSYTHLDVYKRQIEGKVDKYKQFIKVYKFKVYKHKLCPRCLLQSYLFIVGKYLLFCDVLHIAKKHNIFLKSLK